MGRRPQEKRRGMKNVKNKKTLWMILTGLIIGAIAVLLVANGNPKNMGFCIACFIRDIAGGVGMHQAAIVQYIRPEIIGLVLGALIMSVAGKEFKAQGGSSPVTRFVLGFFVMVGALMFLGCPLRMVLRIAGGDLNAVVGLVGFVVGILAGIFCLNQGFSLRRTYEQSPLEGGMISAINVALDVYKRQVPVPAGGRHHHRHLSPGTGEHDCEKGHENGPADGCARHRRGGEHELCGVP